MKRFIPKFFYNILIGAVIFLGVVAWVTPELKVGLLSKILLSVGMFCWLIVFSIPTRSQNDKIAEQVQNTPKNTMVSLLLQLDPEDDIKFLKRLRKYVNTKISHSNTNKHMIRATKEICGKNCKCPVIKKSAGCEYCDMYDAYVEYLKATQEE